MQGEEVSPVNVKIIIVKKEKKKSSSSASSLPQTTTHHHHHLKKKISSKVPQRAKPESLASPSRGSRRGWPWGAAGSRPRRAGGAVPMLGAGIPRHPGSEPGQPGRPSPCFPVPVVLRPRKPASASPRRDAPSSPCPKENATRRCSRSRPRRHQRGVPTPGGWGEGRQGRGSLQSLPRRQSRRRSLRAISADSYMGGGQRLRRGIMK